MWDVERVRRTLAELDGRLAELSERADAVALDAVRTLVDVYGEALARVTALVEKAAPEVSDALADDELVGHLLLVHDLHPHEPETRIRRALADLRPRIVAELTDYADDGVTVAIEGVARSGVSDATETVEAVVRAVAPEVTDVRVRHRSEPAFVPLTAVRAR